MFKRIIDLHLDSWKRDPYRKPLLLRGARQVGKTYAVRRLGQGVASLSHESQKNALDHLVGG